MNLKKSFWRNPAIAIALTGLLGWLPGPQRVNAGGTAAEFRGRAVVVAGAVVGVPVTICDTGSLPASGGALQASLLQQSIPGVLAIEVCHAATIGQGDMTSSEASAGSVRINVGLNFSLSADAVISRAMATCCSPGPSVSACSEIAGLVINGQAISVTGQANQTILLANGKVIVNEQIASLTADTADMTCNALHVVINGAADIVLSSAYAGITCAGETPPGGGTPPPECGDFVTGGGWITGTPSGAKANFGVAGGIKDGAFWGHLNYIDHGNGMHVKATAVTGYEVDPADADCRIISYNVTIDGTPGTARVRACDKGEPGRDDMFEIALSNGYQAGGDLGGSRPGGGNIQLHKCN